MSVLIFLFLKPRANLSNWFITGLKHGLTDNKVSEGYQHDILAPLWSIVSTYKDSSHQSLSDYVKSDTTAGRHLLIQLIDLRQLQVYKGPTLGSTITPYFDNPNSIFCVYKHEASYYPVSLELLLYFPSHVQSPRWCLPLAQRFEGSNPAEVYGF